jgi:hypothetical protein
MKDKHNVNWKCARDFWCAILRTVIGKAIVQMERGTSVGGESYEVSNNILRCQVKHCHHVSAQGTGFRGHLDKCHDDKLMPSMGIWGPITQAIRENRDLTIGTSLEHKMSLCGHERSRSGRTHSDKTRAHTIQAERLSIRPDNPSINHHEKFTLAATNHQHPSCQPVHKVLPPRILSVPHASSIRCRAIR